MSRRMLIILLILVTPPLTALAVLVSQQTRLILPATVNAVPAPSPELNFAFTSLFTPDGHTLQGIIFLPEGKTANELVFAFPGNAHNPIGFAQFLKTEVYTGRNDVAIVALSYRGYPNGITPASTGQPSQAAMFADAELLYDTFTARFQPKKVKVVGYSIGTAVAAHLATARKLDAMVLVAPIASVRRIAQDRFPWLPVSLLLRHPFATEDILADIHIPATLIYSPTDGLVPADHVTEVLHKANPNIPIIPIEGTDHQTLAISSRLPGLLQQALSLSQNE